jgi:hypothetical protein
MYYQWNSVLAIVFVCLALFLVGQIPPVIAQSSENYSLHASAFTSGGGQCASENFQNHDAAIGQAAIGVSSTPLFGVNAGFINNQVLDFTPPTTPVWTDAGEETTDWYICATWVTEDLQSGIFDNIVGVDTVPFYDNIEPFRHVGTASEFCFHGPWYEYCTT